MWKGRFAQDTSSLVQQFGESISYDWRLFPHDIAGSIAHARAQVEAGILTREEFLSIEEGLRGIQEDIEAGRFEFKVSLEDIHMNIESELTKRIGAVGGKLHTASQEMIRWQQIRACIAVLKLISSRQGFKLCNKLY
jgi:argininosuccinate lyase